MRKHKERIGLLGGLILVGILFLLSSTDLILKEKQQDIYTVAVILPEDSDALSNYRKGIDQAASMENVDVHYETVYKIKDGYDYETAALQTAEDGPEAVILLGVNGEEEDWLGEAARGIPVISLGTSRPYRKNSCQITADYKEQGKLLAESILEDSEPGEQIQIFSQRWGQEETRECAAQMEQILNEQGRTTERVVNYKSLQEAKTAVLEMESMSKILQMDDMQIQLYGIGYTSEAVEAMAEKRIQALALANEYDMGYLAMQSAVQIIDGELQCLEQTMESILVRPEDVYGQYEAVLFPIS